MLGALLFGREPSPPKNSELARLRSQLISA